jgi:hypothetical protein
MNSTVLLTMILTVITVHTQYLQVKPLKQITKKVSSETPRRRVRIGFTLHSSLDSTKHENIQYKYYLDPTKESFWLFNHLAFAKFQNIIVKKEEEQNLLSFNRIENLAANSMVFQKPILKGSIMLGKQGSAKISSLQDNEDVALCQPMRGSYQDYLAYPTFILPKRDNDTAIFFQALQEISSLRTSDDLQSGLYSDNEMTVTYTLRQMTETKVPANNSDIKQYVATIRDLETNSIPLRIVASRWLAQGNNDVFTGWAKQFLKNAKGVSHLDLRTIMDLLVTTPEQQRGHVLAIEQSRGKIDGETEFRKQQRNGSLYLAQLLGDSSVSQDTKLAAQYTLAYLRLWEREHPFSIDSEQISKALAQTTNDSDPLVRMTGARLLMNFYEEIYEVRNGVVVEDSKFRANFIQKYRGNLEEAAIRSQNKGETEEIMNFLSKH